MLGDMDNTRSIGAGRILVIERDLAVAGFAQIVLGNWEAFDVTSVTEPAVVLSRIETEPWDLVLVDFDLPGPAAQGSQAPEGALDAMGLLAAIREAEPRLPVAMMTASPVTGPAAESLRAADGHVTKPITPSHLIGLATGLIEQSRRAREQAGGR